MDYQNIEFDVQKHVAWITINRPTMFNALDRQTMQELLHIANRCGSDKGIRAAVLTGAGEKAFCAGGDIAEFSSNSDAIEMLLKEMTGYLHVAISRFARMNPPLIAAINGVAAGAGLSLCAATDLAICTEKSTFTSAYTKIGLSPDGSSSYFLTRILGIRRTMELYLTNRVLDADTALDWGLVNQVVAQEDLMDTVTALAEKLASGPTQAHGGVKKLVQTALNDTLDSQMEREARTIVGLAGTDDGKEGIEAFAAKRKPEFTGL